MESGIETRQNIANKYGIGKSTVHDIHKRRDVIKNFALQNTSELSKRRRVDIKMEMRPDNQLMFKDECNGIVEEETLVENFDHEEFDYNNDQEYEIVYEPMLNNREMDTKPLIEIPEKSNQENSAKRKSKTLTLKEKYDILIQLDAGKSISTIISKYGIGRTTLYDLKKQKQKIFEYMENCSGETRRTFKKSNYPEIENSLLEWCNMRDYYTEQQFFEKYKELFMQRKNNSSSTQSPFTGSWSWCKRFFERNPEHKRKLITSKSMNDTSFKPENKVEDSVKLFCESDSLLNIDDKSDLLEQLKTSPSRRISNYLSLNDKVQVIDEACTGKPVPTPSDKWNVSKSTMYDILKKDNDILTNGDQSPDRKSIKHSRSSDIEKELVDWCLQQDSLPNYSSISEKAYAIYDSENLKGDFNPSSNWAKKFVERHPELNERFNEESLKKTLNESVFNDAIEDDRESTIENIQEETLEYIEPEFMKSDPKMIKIEQDDYGNEYIVEELDDDVNALEAVNYEDHDETENTVNKPKDDDNSEESIVSDLEAMNSLKILIKYSQQRGHDEISELLLEYQNILLEDENVP